MTPLIRPLIALGAAALLTACAKGDDVFGDARRASDGTYNNEIARLQSQNAAADAQFNALSAQNAQLNAARNQLDAAIGQENARIASLDTQIAAFEADALYESQLTQAGRAERSRRLGQVNGLRSSISATQQDIARSQQREQQALTSLAASQTSISASQAQIEANNRIAAEEAKQRDLYAKLERDRANLEKDVVALYDIAAAFQ